MFDFWFNLTWPARLIAGIVLIWIAVFVYLFSEGTRIAVGIGVLGLISILFCTAGYDRSDYNF